MEGEEVLEILERSSSLVGSMCTPAQICHSK